MKNIIKIAAFAVFGMFLASCETYKVGEPDYTAVKGIDGNFVCFAYENQSDAEPVSVFHVLITNTTDDSASEAWMTVTDCAPKFGTYNFLDATRFKMSAAPATHSFSASGVDATEPRTCFNVWLGQGYYTYAYRTGFSNYKVSVSGKVTPDGKTLSTGYKADVIEFTYTRTDEEGNSESYYVKGIRNTGWEEEMSEFSAWMDENL